MTSTPNPWRLPECAAVFILGASSGFFWGESSSLAVAWFDFVWLLSEGDHFGFQIPRAVFGLTSALVATAVFAKLRRERGIVVSGVIALIAIACATAPLHAYKWWRSSRLSAQFSVAATAEVEIERVAGGSRAPVRLVVDGDAAQGVLTRRGNKAGLLSGATVCRTEMTSGERSAILLRLGEAGFWSTPRVLDEGATLAHEWLRIGVFRNEDQFAVLGLRAGSRGGESLRRLERAVTQPLGLAVDDWWRCCLDGPEPRRPCRDDESALTPAQ